MNLFAIMIVMIDLHTHSTASDGTFSPAELAAEAHKAGLSLFALTDHDTVAGVAEAQPVKPSVYVCCRE